MLAKTYGATICLLRILPYYLIYLVLRGSSVRILTLIIYRTWRNRHSINHFNSSLFVKFLFALLVKICQSSIWKYCIPQREHQWEGPQTFRLERLERVFTIIMETLPLFLLLYLCYTKFFMRGFQSKNDPIWCMTHQSVLKITNI